MENGRRDVVLEVRDVTMKFNKYEVGVNSLKELVVRAFKKNLKKNLPLLEPYRLEGYFAAQDHSARRD